MPASNFSGSVTAISPGRMSSLMRDRYSCAPALQFSSFMSSGACGGVLIAIALNGAPVGLGAAVRGALRDDHEIARLDLHFLVAEPDRAGAFEVCTGSRWRSGACASARCRPAPRGSCRPAARRLSSAALCPTPCRAPRRQVGHVDHHRGQLVGGLCLLRGSRREPSRRPRKRARRSRGIRRGSWTSSRIFVFWCAKGNPQPTKGTRQNLCRFPSPTSRTRFPTIASRSSSPRG